MPRSVIQQSHATLASVRTGVIYGILIGAVAGILGHMALAMFLDAGAGGPGLGAISGMAAGGLIGFFGGMLASRRPGYRGPERRVSRDAYRGIDRRARHGV